MRIFRLVESYEFYIELPIDKELVRESTVEKKLIRVEIFEAADEGSVFRARIWLKNFYNLYPTFLNLGERGEDLHRIHSSDSLNVEITGMTGSPPEWETGTPCSSERIFFDMVRANVVAFFEKSDQPA